MVLLPLSGSRSLTALGLMSVEVIMKKTNSRNTRSDMVELLFSMVSLFLVSIMAVLFLIVPVSQTFLLFIRRVRGGGP